MHGSRGSHSRAFLSAALLEAGGWSCCLLLLELLLLLLLLHCCTAAAAAAAASPRSSELGALRPEAVLVFGHLRPSVLQLRVGDAVACMRLCRPQPCGWHCGQSHLACSDRRPTTRGTTGLGLCYTRRGRACPINNVANMVVLCTGQQELGRSGHLRVTTREYGLTIAPPW